MLVHQRVDFKFAAGHQLLLGSVPIVPSYLADDYCLTANARERQLRSMQNRVTTDSVTELLQLPGCRPRTLEQFTSQRCGLTIQSVPAVTKDIFLWTVEPWHSVNHFNCAT